MRLKTETHVEHRAAGESDTRLAVLRKNLGLSDVLVPGASSTSTIGGCSCCSCGAPTVLKQSHPETIN